jgi:hypothetical protein
MRVEGTLATDEPAALALRMGKHFGHKVPVETAGRVTRVRIPAGTFELEPADGALRIRLEPGDPAALERLREVVAARLARFARGADVTIAWG